MTRVAMLSVHACPLAKLGGRDSGGMNVYVRELARDLGARGIEVDVFTRWRERYDPRIQQLGPNARVIHVESGPIGYWPKMAVYEHLDQFGEKLLEHVAAEGKRYDLVHAHYWLSAKVARTLAEHWRVPRIQMFHTLGLVKREVLDEDIDGESDVRVAIEREAVRESAAIVAASTIELAELRQLYRADPSRVAVIPCGVDPEVFKPVRQADAREALGRDQCERLVLFVGRIEQIKGIDVLLRALGLLFQRHPDLRSDVCLLVVGGALDPGDDAPETEKILELRRLVHEHRMEANVAFVGSRDQEQLALYYAAADVCAVPSLTESFGLVALEAMACGTPVVGTRVGGLQTLIEDGESGLLVPAGDDTALAEAIHAVLTDHRLRTHLSHGARERAERFTWSRVGQRMTELYDKVLAAAAGGRGAQPPDRVEV
ncbi:MAG: glycosyltransferase family 1 protein [Chloroflexi bacterium]|nr:MAG: glycosyltransferase family 1 protein [Chloroflexota bacterium]TMG38851.1 MAG: glycosyltransferase family 1 protein [Chloroflexota bacterium]